MIVVEHDEAMIRSADYVIDMGPGAGPGGGNIVASGTADEIIQQGDGFTAQYLAGDRQIGDGARRRKIDSENCIRVTGGTGNNLRSVDVEVPLDVLCCVAV